MEFQRGQFVSIKREYLNTHEPHQVYVVLEVNQETESLVIGLVDPKNPQRNTEVVSFSMVDLYDVPPIDI